MRVPDDVFAQIIQQMAAWYRKFCEDQQEKLRQKGVAEDG